MAKYTTMLLGELKMEDSFKVGQLHLCVMMDTLSLGPAKLLVRVQLGVGDGLLQLAIEVPETLYLNLLKLS